MDIFIALMLILFTGLFILMVYANNVDDASFVDGEQGHSAQLD